MFLTSISRVSRELWWCSVWCFGPPCCKCIVNRRERVVQVRPIYELVWCSHSPIGHLYSYIRLVCWSGGGLVIFHNEWSCGCVFIVYKKFKFVLWVSTFGVGADYLFEDAFVSFVCVGKLWTFAYHHVSIGLLRNSKVLLEGFSDIIVFSTNKLIYFRFR